MKIVTVVGARPQFVKAATISRVLRSRRDIVEVLVHTGQHYDENMSNVFFEEMEIPYPDYNLGIGSGLHGEQTGRMLAAIEQVALDVRPDQMLVYGDTNSTIAGALAAAKLHIPLGHVEAGLRSFNRAMPEEVNRVVADHLADVLFAPTETAVGHLLREGIPSARVFFVGDVMYDAVLHYGAMAERRSTVLERLGLASQEYVLATVHRAENTDTPSRLAAIFEGLGRVAERLPVVLPLHPRTRKALEASSIRPSRQRALRIIEPVGYLDVVMLEKHARLVVTDSGGVQKEAFFHRVPCVTLRTETEWTELVDSGWNRVVAPISSDAVAEALAAALERSLPPEPPGVFYGFGDAAERIVDVLTPRAPDAGST